MTSRLPSLVVPLLLALAATLLAAPESRAAQGIEVISHASARGVHKASSGFDTGVSEPAAMFLRVRVEPNKEIKVHYQVLCKSRDEDDVVNRDRVTRSGRIDLPLLVERPSSCLVYSFVTYKNFRYDKPVRFRVTLLAKQRSK